MTTQRISGQIVYLAEPPHRCECPDGDPFPEGTVWKCTCDKLWLRKTTFNYFSVYRWRELRWYDFAVRRKIRNPK
jgi:hypothetical protein